MQELTRLFQAIATTLDYGRKLAFKYRFDKLGIDAQLKTLQDMQASHYVEELQAIEPILQKIADDPNMMHINRVTAKQLLKSMGISGVPIRRPPSRKSILENPLEIVAGPVPDPGTALRRGIDFRQLRIKWVFNTDGEEQERPCVSESTD